MAALSTDCNLRIIVDSCHQVYCSCASSHRVVSAVLMCWFDVGEPVATRDAVVFKVMAASMNDFDRAAVEGTTSAQRAS